MDAMWLAFRTRQWARAWEILHMPNVQPDVELYHLGLTTLNRGKFQYKRVSWVGSSTTGGLRTPGC